MELDDHYIAVPVGKEAEYFRGVVELNKDAMKIFDLLKNDISEEQIVSELRIQYPDDSSIADCVHEAIDYFRSEGVLE
jgi:hypothetical protein